jgi:23S rRNA (pseudouridine1915-N3)-methyltransferase
MNIQLLLIGKTGFPFVREGMEEYSKRLKKYVDFRIHIIPDLKSTRSWSGDQLAREEGKKILHSLNARDYAVLLDERGEDPDSFEFARFLENQMLGSVKSLVFVIGGAYGFSPEVYQRGNKLLSLSRMTFSHQMIRLFFMEQLYRAFTIVRGEPYHHG